MRVLVACEYSGVVRDAFASLGHDAWSCDLLPTDVDGQHIQGDCLSIDPTAWDIIIAHPPCTHLAVSGSRWFAEKRADGRQQAAIKLFMDMVNWGKQARIGSAVENPVCIMSTHYQKPTQYIQPWQFGHGETKKTGLWLDRLPPLQPTNIVSGREPRIHRMPPSANRWKLRSQTYQGIAQAMAEQWGIIR